MTTVRAVYDFLDAWAPFSTAMSFDNAGLLAGNGKEEVRRAVLALDITPDVVREAAGCGAQLIISHHPVIFDPLRRLFPGSAPWLLAQNGLAAICAHTNLDLAPGGVNTCLAQRLGLSDIRTLGTDVSSGLPESLCGDLSAPMEPRAFALHVGKASFCSRHLHHIAKSLQYMIFLHRIADALIDIGRRRNTYRAPRSGNQRDFRRNQTADSIFENTACMGAADFHQLDGGPVIGLQIIDYILNIHLFMPPVPQTVQ